LAVCKRLKLDNNASYNSGKLSEGSTGMARTKKKGKKVLPIWDWILIGMLVLVGGYLRVRSIAQKSPKASGLPLEISVSEAAGLDRREWFFLDVRELDEWEEGHIPDAALIPLGELTARMTEIPKDKSIIVVCRSGRRSAVGRDLLLNAGYTNVTSLAGGMNEWKAQGNSIVTGP